MPTPRRSSLETPTARLRLPVQKKPHWLRLGPGLSLGYRRNQGPGAWSIRAADGKGGEWLKKFGTADDYETADGRRIMNYIQAIDAARKLTKAGDAALDEGKPMTLADALTAYEADLKARQANFRNARIPPKHISAGLLAKPATLLDSHELRRFRDAMLAMLKPASVNRISSNIRAALHLAGERDPRLAANRRAWETGLEMIPDAVVARNVILGDREVRAVIAAADAVDPRFGLYVHALAETGARSSQILRLVVSDLIAHVPEPKLMMPKSGKGGGRNRARKLAERYSVPITPELAARLKEAAQARAPDALLVDTSAWGGVYGAVFRRLARETVAAAGLDPDVVTLYALRHSSIVRQLLANTPVRVTASLHDTSVAEIERHYARYIVEHSDALARRALLRHEPLAPPAADNVVKLR
jgi:integrase